MQASKVKAVLLAAIFAFLFLASVQPLDAQSNTAIRVVKISAGDQMAVVKFSGQPLQLVKTGDVLQGIGRIAEIAADRLVIENMGPTGMELIVIRLQNGQQTVERIKKGAREDQQLMTPSSPGTPAGRRSPERDQQEDN